MGSPGWKPTAGELRARESGTRRPLSFRASVSRRQCDAAALSGDKTIAHRWSGGVNCLELDETERRYLLAGTVDAVVAVYDSMIAAAPGPVLRLNRAVAIAERDGPSAGLELLDAVGADHPDALVPAGAASFGLPSLLFASRKVQKPEHVFASRSRHRHAGIER